MRAVATDYLGNPIGEWAEVLQVVTGRDDEAVPTGSIVSVLEWVKYDPDRVKAAITAELSRDQKEHRKSLLTELQARLKEE